MSAPLPAAMRSASPCANDAGSRTGYGDGLGEPDQGFGITAAGSGHLVREGANFSILYRLTTCANLAGTNVVPSARVTLNPDGNAKGWNLGATFTGDRSAAMHHDTTGTVSRWGRWISENYLSSKVTVWVLDIWVHGTTTDDNCIGTPTDSSATASVAVHLLDGDGTSQSAREITIRKVEDDTSAGRKLPCT